MSRKITAATFTGTAIFCLTAMAALPAVAAEKIFSFDDQYIQIEAGISSGTGKAAALEVLMTPKPGWKLLAGNSSSIKPLRLKVAPSKCLKLQGGTVYSPPDLSGTDDSGAYSEYFTKTASVRQEFFRLKCPQKSALDSSATLTFLLCQDNKCVGPFSKEMKFKAAAR